MEYWNNGRVEDWKIGRMEEARRKASASRLEVGGSLRLRLEATTGEVSSQKQADS